MCMSPDEMPSARIERIVASYRESAIRCRAEGNERMADIYETAANNYESILKERANNGTYHTDGITLVLNK